MSAEISIADYLKLVLPVITATGAAAGGAVKFVLNGSAKRIQSIDQKVDGVANTVGQIDRRLVRVETIVDPDQRVA